ncbi:hypothetical protein TorRG33x02_088110, partial [Trema orientale]
TGTKKKTCPNPQFQSGHYQISVSIFCIYIPILIQNLIYLFF